MTTVWVLRYNRDEYWEESDYEVVAVFAALEDAQRAARDAGEWIKNDRFAYWEADCPKHMGVWHIAPFDIGVMRRPDSWDYSWEEDKP